MMGQISMHTNKGATQGQTNQWNYKNTGSR